MNRCSVADCHARGDAETRENGKAEGPPGPMAAGADHRQEVTERDEGIRRLAEAQRDAQGPRLEEVRRGRRTGKSRPEEERSVEERSVEERSVEERSVEEKVMRSADEMTSSDSAIVIASGDREVAASNIAAGSNAVIASAHRPTGERRIATYTIPRYTASVSTRPVSNITPVDPPNPFASPTPTAAGRYGMGEYQANDANLKKRSPRHMAGAQRPVPRPTTRVAASVAATSDGAAPWSASWWAPSRAKIAVPCPRSPRPAGTRHAPCAGSPNRPASRPDGTLHSTGTSRPVCSW